MAIHTQLPIYKLAYDLLNLASDVTRNMPRDFKQSLGKKIHDECIEMLVLIGRANAAIDKQAHLTRLLEGQHVVELMLRVGHDKRFISHSLYAAAIQLTERIGKQGGAWRNYATQAAKHATVPAV